MDIDISDNVYKFINFDMASCDNHDTTNDTNN